MINPDSVWKCIEALWKSDKDVGNVKTLNFALQGMCTKLFFQYVLWTVLQTIMSISGHGHLGFHLFHPSSMLWGKDRRMNYKLFRTQCLKRKSNIEINIFKKMIYILFFFSLKIVKRVCQVWSTNSYPFLGLQFLCHRVYVWKVRYQFE